MENKKNYYCAIDLGTTNTTLAFGTINPRTGKLDAKCMKLKMKLAEGGIGKKNVVPSCVLIDINENGEIVPTVGPYAKNMNSITPQNVVISTKSEMGKNKDYKIEGKILSPVDISSYILDFVLKNAKEYFKERPNDLVITVPASFDSEMRTDTIKAAKKAGIKLTNEDGSDRNILLDEPRAALYNFINALDKGEFPDVVIDIEKPQNVLVYDLGGGTLDVSLHKVWRNKDGEVEFEDYAISLHTLVGGDNFDKLFTDYLYSKIENKIGDITESEKQRCMSKLRTLAENAKIDMGTQFFENQMMDMEDEELEMEITQANIHDNIAIDELVTEEEYEEIVESLMGNEFTLESVKKVEDSEIIDNLNIIYPILDVLAKANEKACKKVKVDAVLLNGGMTKLPLIQRRLENFFGIKPISLQDAELSVALGGVYYHYNLHNGLKPKTILNDSIGIEVDGGRVEHIAKAGVTLPYKSKVFDKFSIETEGVNRLDFPFYIGSRNDTLSPNRKIADRSTKFDKVLSIHDRVSLQLEINSAGIITTCVWINGDESNRRIMEVDSTTVENESIVEVGQNINNAEYDLRKIKKTNEVYVDTDENKIGKNILHELEKFCKQYEKTNNSGTRKHFINQIKNIESKIKDCTNKHEVVELITDELISGSNNYFYKERLCIVLGELIKVTGLKSDFIDYASSEINNLKYIPSIDSSRKKYLRAMIEALAKSNDSRVEDIFVKALELKPSINKQFVNAIIISLGKVSESIDTFDLISDYLDDDSGAKLEALWALGKIGSREKENPLYVKDISYVIDDFLDIIKNKYEKYVLAPYNALYALAEICDRRKVSDCIESSEANQVIRTIEKAKLCNYTNIVQKDQFEQLKQIAISVIQGQTLTQEQEKCLLGIRAKLTLSA